MILISFLRWHNTRLSSTKPFCLFIVYSGNATERQLEGLECEAIAIAVVVVVVIVTDVVVAVAVADTDTSQSHHHHHLHHHRHCCYSWWHWNVYDSLHWGVFFRAMYDLLAHIKHISLCITSNITSIWVRDLCKCVCVVCVGASRRKSNMALHADSFICIGWEMEIPNLELMILRSFKWLLGILCYK